MSIVFKPKVLVVGPCEVRNITDGVSYVLVNLQAGKTCISNFIAEATESRGGEYQPTQGVR